ncbi:DUF305 domain-containing protein [Marinactinospora thermotolerans]|uniref:DUF305 domain-containing protein n=1 Tax=Marinactinospora thermotolerans TaxID=531310 RepID=UPI002E159814
MPWPIAALLVVVALVAGYLTGRPTVPLDTSVDAGFLRDMTVHHTQAVDMSMTILEKTDEPMLETVAYDIARTQQSQAGRMQGWLVQWGLNARGSQPPMAWMAGHGHGGGSGEAPERMPGLATEDQLRELEEAEGVDAEIVYLRLMIVHHAGGIEMAEVAAAEADVSYVAGFARGMAEAQQSEIDLMNDLLVERGAEPVDV